MPSAQMPNLRLSEYQRKDLLVWQSGISSLARKRDTMLFLNRGHDSAAIVLEQMFKEAKSSILIYASSGFDGPVLTSEMIQPKKAVEGFFQQKSNLLSMTIGQDSKPGNPLRDVLYREQFFIPSVYKHFIRIASPSWIKER